MHGRHIPLDEVAKAVDTRFAANSHAVYGVATSDSLPKGRFNVLISLGFSPRHPRTSQADLLFFLSGGVPFDS